MATAAPLLISPDHLIRRRVIFHKGKSSPVTGYQKRKHQESITEKLNFV